MQYAFQKGIFCRFSGRNKPGTAQVSAQLKVQKSKSFLNIQKNTIVEISTILQYQKTLEGIYKILENLFLAKNSSCAT